MEISKNIKDDNYIDVLTPKMLESGEWRNTSLRPLNVESPAPTIYSGKKHPVRIFIDEVREIFVSLGFQEVEGSIVQSSFWNFDALFTPQDHPAREIQDTFYIENEKECMGMTQLYTTFDSLELSKKIILYDLYVRSEYRNKGIGRMLMNAAKGFAEEKGVTSVELSTAITNKNAQSLYESLNYQRDTEYYDYYLPIK